ncbi:hypothetical protein V6N13_073063 [Hibiscus sabdariffa]|uniref:Uncharacterized protein n=1 Tax=Hibiscus sabdariffa TaxID=183260 RepID=A0ABR2E9U2_9ROSI
MNGEENSGALVKYSGESKKRELEKGLASESVVSDEDDTIIGPTVPLRKNANGHDAFVSGEPKPNHFYYPDLGTVQKYQMLQSSKLQPSCHNIIFVDETRIIEGHVAASVIVKAVATYNIALLHLATDVALQSPL